MNKKMRSAGSHHRVVVEASGKWTSWQIVEIEFIARWSTVIVVRVVVLNLLHPVADLSETTLV